MNFIAVGNSTATAGNAIPNNGFWPDIDPADFRAAQRIDSTVTATRVEQSLLAAVIDANNQLQAWQRAQIAAGHVTIDDVPVPSWQPSGMFTALYLRAVYALAKASLIERYRDYDSSGDGVTRADALELTIDDYRRDAAWALADIVGRRRTTVELI